MADFRLHYDQMSGQTDVQLAAADDGAQHKWAISGDDEIHKLVYDYDAMRRTETFTGGRRAFAFVHMSLTCTLDCPLMFIRTLTSKQLIR